MIKTSLYLNKPLWYRLRMRALEEGVPATHLLERAIEELPQDQEEGDQVRKTLLCAWLLWQSTWNAPYILQDGYPTHDKCVAAANKQWMRDTEMAAAGLNNKRYVYTCLPDTVDPRKKETKG